MKGLSVERGPRESGASCSSRENKADAQDEVEGGTECCETTVLGSGEGVQAGGTAAGHRESVEESTEQGLEMPGRSVGGERERGS